MSADAHYEFLLDEERAALLAGQQHALEKEHYVNSVNLRAAQQLGDVQGAEEQIALAQANLDLIERKLTFLRSERERVDGGAPQVADGDGAARAGPA